MNYFVLLCGGSGKRMNIVTPKQYLKYKDMYIFMYPLLTAIKSKLFKKILIVANENYFPLIKDATKKYKNIELIKGGKTRQESVFNALNYFDDIKDKDYIMIHDSARIFIKTELLKLLIDSAKKGRNSIPFKYEKNALFDSKSNQYLDRESIKIIETPQTFKLSEIKMAHTLAKKEKYVNVLDDGCLFLKYIAPLNFVENKQYNLKITTLEDIKEIEKYL